MSLKLTDMNSAKMQIIWLILFVWQSHCQTEKYSSWTVGRGEFTSNIDSGQCSFSTIPNTTFPYRFIGLVGSARWNDSKSCGGCFEIMCIGDWTNSLDAAECCQINSTVTVQITDYCDECTDKDHLTFADETKHKLQNDTSCNSMWIQYRRVSCDITDQNISIVNEFGNNPWYYVIHVQNVAKYGTISQVSLREFNDTSWLIATRSNDNLYSFNSTNGDAWTLPFSIRITDTQGNNLTAYDLINDYSTDLLEYDFGSNYDMNNNEVSTESLGPSSTPTHAPTSDYCDLYHTQDVIL